MPDVAQAEWIARARGEAILSTCGVQDAGARLTASSQIGEVRSQGVPAIEGGEPVPIDPSLWAIWRFNSDRQSLDPPSSRRIASGFAAIQISRAEVEALAKKMTQEARNTANSRPLSAKEQSDVGAASHARVRAGRREKYDWDEAKQYVEKLFREQGDPNDPGQVNGWRSDTDVADAVVEHFEKLAKKGEPTPDPGTVRNKIRPWLGALRERNARI
jgi:hypothetical protein